jgi:regulator of PEP synthase PpsR (kinase-PPPase family)
MLTILAVSDGTANTVERLVRSALTQFRNTSVRVVRKVHIRTAEQVRSVVHEAAAQRAVIVHTLVSNEMRRLMHTEAHTYGVDATDVMGPLLDRLATRLRLAPQEVPGLFEQLVEARTRQIDVVEFAFHHDDGQNSGDLSRAQVVLVGPSRTMKTPTMLYLAYRGWFAANVPLVAGVELPAGLVAVPPERVVCLMVSPTRLLELRKVRAHSEAIPAEFYATQEQVRTDLLLAERLCATHGWRRIDVTTKSAEEVGQEIIALLAGQGPR